MDEIVEVAGISDYVDHICKLGKGKNGERTYLFRGQPDTQYKLIPSLGRETNRIGLFPKERNLIETAKNKNPDIFSGNMQPVELLSLLQHYGIPTRLLDVTENALVALYFACCSHPENNGEVILFFVDGEMAYNPPIINAIADSYRFAKVTSLETFFDQVVKQPYFLEQQLMAEVCWKSKEKKEKYIEGACKKPIFVHAPVKTLRQRIQQGRYILFPNKIIELREDSKGFWPEIEPLSKEHECIARRFFIPAMKKEEILENLKKFGISKSALFSDNVDAVCEEIRKEYHY